MIGWAVGSRMQVLVAGSKGDEEVAWMVLPLETQRAVPATVGLGLMLWHLKWGQTDWILPLSTLAMG